MRFFYVDASALVKRYAAELGTDLLNRLFARLPPKRILVFNVGIAEVVSVLVRKRNAGHLTPAVFSQALVDFGAEIVSSADIRKVIADNALVTAALPLIATYSINGSDAILLQSALEVAAQFRPAGNDLVLVASDQRLLKAAQAQGLVTFNPETQSQAEFDALIGP